MGKVIEGSPRHPCLALGTALPRHSQPEIVGGHRQRVNTILVSAASIWEIGTKARIGKLPEAEELEKEIFEAIDDASYQLLSISPQAALRASRLPGKHRDPFDRLIAAQALVEDLFVLSSDVKLDQFGVICIW